MHFFSIFKFAQDDGTFYIGLESKAT